MFHESQFNMEGFSEPYCTVNGGRILLYVRQNIPIKCIKGVAVSNSFEDIFIELNLKDKKSLLGCSYNVHRGKIISQLNTIRNSYGKFNPVR